MNRFIKMIMVLFIAFFPLLTFAQENKITLYFFHGNGCPHCAEEEKFLEKLQKDYPDLDIVRLEVWYDEDNAALLKKVEEVFKVTHSGVPTNIIGSTIIKGYSEANAEKIERAIRYYQENKYEDILVKIKNDEFSSKDVLDDGFEKKEKESDKKLSLKLPFIGKINLKQISIISAATVIGFVDGFNPCAMWILLFLISVLIGMKDRKRMWILGLAFLLTSALVYMLIMLSWIQIAVKITTIIWVRNIIALVALIGAFINLRSFIKAKDSGCEVISEKKRKKVFQKIRKFTSEKSFILALFGVIGLAISVNLVELACSAGLPLVFTELLALNNTSDSMKFLYTLVYIFFFLIDDLIIFFIAMFTMKITGISTKYNKFSHLLGGLIMLIVGLLLIFKPEWLMFNF